MEPTVYLNGSWCAPESACINVNDRGFLFGDSVYEATPAYHGRFLRLEQHLARLRHGLDALRINADEKHILHVHHELLSRNALIDAPWSMIYTQITRGVAPRGHAFPEPEVAPTVYLFARKLTRPSDSRWQAGYSAVTYPDLRWQRADLKTNMLLGNVLAQQAAVQAGVDDVILVRDDLVLEGSHANLFVVLEEGLVTAPLDHRVLPGITRSIVVELAAKLGIPVSERDIPVADLQSATEVLLCGTTTEIRPLTRIDGACVGDGQVGPVACRLREAFQSMLIQGINPAIDSFR